MKKTVHLIAVYFVSLCVSTLVIAFLYMIIKTSMLMVAGSTISVFSFYLFRDGCLLVLPFTGILALLFQLLSAIKTNDTSVLSFFIALFFVLLTWLILLPSSLAKAPNFLLQSTDVTSIQLSTNLFRVVDDVPQYYLEANNDGTYKTISINTDSYNGSQLIESPSISIPRGLFADPLLEGIVAYPRYIQKTISTSISFYLVAREAVFSGKLAWVCFASLGMCLFSLWLVVGSSQWRMVDLVVVCGFFVFLFALQVEMYTDTKIHAFILQIPGYLSLPDSIVIFVPPLIYLIISVIIGTIGSIKRYKMARLGIIK